ncbi:MAG: nitric-oxide reductase large subunit [Acidobacteria bacterium]|nr:nitric-oxide reductase large subunit [Acidobacteriota bacterium]
MDTNSSIARTIRKSWWLLTIALVLAFTILGFFGREVYRQAPPIPERVVTTSGQLVTTKDDILSGQQVWQSTGGQQLGSIWGHGAYQAPDWSADWLHREALALLDEYAQREGHLGFESAPEPTRAMLRARLEAEVRKNTFDVVTGTITITDERARAIERTASHYRALFGGGGGLQNVALREAYAMVDTTIPDATRREQLTDFFFWTAWACATERPDSAVTYTNNWPHEPLIGNRPTAANIVWSMISIVALLAGVGAIVWWSAFRGGHDEAATPPGTDPMRSIAITPSMRAVAKYLGVVVAVFGVQVILGAITAHYTVEGRAFFGFPLADYLPYALTRTWHIQTAVFWIATAFLGAGLFLAPAVGGREPRFQRAGVNALFVALLVVVAGSLAGEWFAIHQRLGLDASFWFGHQGYEYVDLGRAWQIALFTGLVLWLVLMLRALWPAITRRDEGRPIVLMFAGASAAIGLMYAAGFFFGARTHLSVMEYWRWWVVHLWVEGFFEVFATAAIAFVFAQMGLVKKPHAGAAVIASSALFLFAGIPGTFHHLYFSGTPTSIMAIGATFSALEVVPLVLIGLEAFRTSRMQNAAPWMQRYRWPIRFFVGVSFWNLVGAGIFGFLINPPVALYYMQGLNTTPVHAHSALFGVYGLLSLGLVLLVARHLTGHRRWREAPIAIAFVAMNGGLALMIALSLLPIGLAQAWVSVDTGLWYARSADFLQLPALEFLRWLRIVGDTVFLAGVAVFAWFMLGLWTGWSYSSAHQDEPRAMRSQDNSRRASDHGLLRLSSQGDGTTRGVAWCRSPRASFGHRSRGESAAAMVRAAVAPSAR